MSGNSYTADFKFNAKVPSHPQTEQFFIVDEYHQGRIKKRKNKTKQKQQQKHQHHNGNSITSLTIHYLSAPQATSEENWQDRLNDPTGLTSASFYDKDFFSA